MKDNEVNLIDNIESKYKDIESYILSLHWMMKNICFFNVGAQW